MPRREMWPSGSGLRPARRYAASYHSAGATISMKAKAVPADPIPRFLLELFHGITGFEVREAEHVLVTEYAPGAPIGWHVQPTVLSLRPAIMSGQLQGSQPFCRLGNGKVRIGSLGPQNSVRTSPVLVNTHATARKFAKCPNRRVSARSAVGNAGEWLLTAGAKFRLLSGDPGFRCRICAQQSEATSMRVTLSSHEHAPSLPLKY